MDISDIPDFPAVQQLANALWGQGSRRGVAAFIGAGFSKYAELSGADTPEPPLWTDLTERMVKQLYPHGSSVPRDQLRVAEEYRIYFGQSALDQFIRAQIRDEAWLPGPLHKSLLELSWTDILTTNWDTLLERASHSINEIYYQPVRSTVELAQNQAPRIVKLHGSLGTSDHFIVAEEDYRTYPIRYAAFVNFARQVFIENELCLIGFSGDDPNFLQWSGWVRDNLGSAARRIYLVGVLELTPPTRKLLEARNVAPIDLAPLVSNVDERERHSAATKTFLEFLAKSRPVQIHDWHPTDFSKYESPKTIEDQQRQFKDSKYAATLLDKAGEIWRYDRQSCPAWLVFPFDRRRALQTGLDLVLPIKKEAIAALTQHRRAEVLYELAWRRTVAYQPFDDLVVGFLGDIADPTTPCGLEKCQQLELAVTLLRYARRQHDQDALIRWSTILENCSSPESEIRAEIAYARSLYARDELDFARLTKEQEAVDGPDPIWKMRRAALLAELGRFAEMARLINEASADLNIRQRQDRTSLWVLSRRAWVEWFALALQRDNFSTRNEARWPGEFREANCDPRTEIEAVEYSAQHELRERKEREAPVIPTFEMGHYRDPSDTVRVTHASTASSLEWLDLLIETVGIPLRLNHLTLLSPVTADALELAFQPTFIWYVWFLRNLHSSQDAVFERRFGRISIAQLSREVALALAAAARGSISFWRERVTIGIREKDIGSLYATERLRIFVDVLARLTPHMDVAEARSSFELAIDLAEDRSLRHWWLFEPIGHLAKFSSQAIPAADRTTLTWSAVKFPMSSEIGAQPGVPQMHWPNPVSFLFEVPPNRTMDNPEWDQRISELISAAKSGSSSREEAVLRLAYLNKHSALTDKEKNAFGEALWSSVDVDPNPLPANTRLLAYAYGELPAPEGIDRVSRVSARLFGMDLTDLLAVPAMIGSQQMDEKRSWLTALAASGQSDIKPNREQARNIFDILASWRPIDPASAGEDFFRASIVKTLNRTNRRLIGEALGNVIVPSLATEDRTITRVRALLALTNDAHVYAAMTGLPHFLGIDHRIDLDVVQAIRRALAGRSFDEVGSASFALEAWIRVSLGSLPSELVDQAISTVEIGESLGLHALLHCLRLLIGANRLDLQELSRVAASVDNLSAKMAYDQIDPDSITAVSVPLVRAECVRIAAVLEATEYGHSSAKRWLEAAKQDPLPEVRFALAD